MANPELFSRAADLEEIQERLGDIVDELKAAVKGTPVEQHALAYCIHQIQTAAGLNLENHFETTLQNEIDDLIRNRCGDCGEEMDDDVDGEDNELCGFCRGEL